MINSDIIYFYVCILKNDVLLLPAGVTAWDGGYSGSGYVSSMRRWWWGDWKEMGWVWRLAPTAPQIYFWEQIKETWKTSHAAIKLRHSWKSSCLSYLMSSFFVRWSKTPGSFWFFVKAHSSVFVEVRNSVLTGLYLLSSFPAYFWKH